MFDPAPVTLASLHRRVLQDLAERSRRPQAASSASGQARALSPPARGGDARRPSTAVDRALALPADLEILRLRGLSPVLLLIAVREGRRRSCAPARVLLERGLVSCEAYYSAFAEACDLGFLPRGSFRSRHTPAFPPPADFPGPLSIGRNADGETIVALAPVPECLPRIRSQLGRFPQIRRRIRIVSPQALSDAVRMADPTARLALTRPEMSARKALTRPQAAVAGGGLALFLAGLASSVGAAALVASLAVTAVGMVPGAVRLAAGLRAARSPMPGPLPNGGPPAGGGRLPLYSVLVPVYREARVIPALVRSLARFSYPRHRHEILFLLEADDPETRAALEPLLLPNMRILTVPPGTPRTKPRALCHGLDAARGELIAVFDGEDRPDPDQLHLAARRFAELPARVAALQAHLVIDHSSLRFFPRQFRFEYAALFDCLLPWLSSRGWPFPLGGTSNHFRREALEAVGGWDPHNVTEDADLAVRLVRGGYRLQTFASATNEEAPLGWRAWHRQRTRWLKGWLQVLLVTFRDPLRLAGEIGRRKLFVLVLYLSGMVVTLAVHPVFMGLLAFYAAGMVRLEAGAGWLMPSILCLAAASVFLSCGSTALAMTVGARRRGWRPSVVDMALIPVYWLAQSIAFYAALLDIVRAPHRWAKTEHGVARRPGDLPMRDSPRAPPPVPRRPPRSAPPHAVTRRGLAGLLRRLTRRRHDLA